MLKDITIITKKVFAEFIPDNKPINSKKALYDTYRALQLVVNDLNLVSEHYLALDFSEGYLQNSSFGTPADKWRRFFNEDLESLNKSIKTYLMKLNLIATYDEIVSSSSYLSKIYNAKSFYGFVRDEYNVGYVEPCGFDMISLVLTTSNDDNSSVYIEEFSKIDLSTFEKRVELQKNLRAKKDILLHQIESLKAYLLKNFVIEDLL